MAISPFIGFLLFSLIPMIVSLVISFTELHSTIIDYAQWTGFSNYKKIVTDPMFYKAFGNTLYYCVSVIVNMAVSLFLANVLASRKIFGEKIWRVIFFLPQVCSTVAVTVMWSWIFNKDYGMINTVIQPLGIKFTPYETGNQFMPAVLIISLWQNGTNIILLQSALANVDKSLQEAAKIDGATDNQVFWKITFLLITPTLFYQLIMGFIAASQELALMQVLSGGGVGPDHAAVTVSYYLYRMVGAGLATQGFGLSCATSWLFSIIIVIITRILFKINDKYVVYD